MIGKLQHRLCAFMLLLGAAAQADAASDSALPEMVKKAAASIVMIDTLNASGRHVRGAGFVYDGKGRIVTAYHVVEASASIHLTFADGRRTKARIAAHDAPFDVAVLTADISPAAPPLTIAAEDPALGTRVIAIGYPFGHAFSVSAGIVSGHDRTYDLQTPHGFLQHDAALNPGNSGGPLLDGNGHVAGLNAAIPNGRRSDVGVGFAIPGKVVARILAILDRDGAVRHGYLGARLRALDHALAAALNRAPSGAAVEEVEAGGPAQKAGLRPGDIILSIDGRPIGSLRHVSEKVTGGSPGSRIALAGLRDGAALNLVLELGHSSGAATVSAERPAKSPAVNLGLTFAPSGPAAVAAVTAGSPAAVAGLKKGDLILAIGQKPVAAAGEARSAMAAIAAGPLAVLVSRKPMGARYVILQGGQYTSAPLFDGNREPEGTLPF